MENRASIVADYFSVAPNGQTHVDHNASLLSSPGVDRALSEAARSVVTSVAEELSQPVTSLLLKLELMLVEAGDPGGQAARVDDLHTLHRSARRVVHLIEALRCYSGDGPAAIQPVRVNDIVARARASIGVSSMTLALDPGDPLILGDGPVLEWFVGRVLADACRTSRAESDVRVETAAAPGDAYHVVLRVSGVGGVPDLAESSRQLLAEYSGTLDARTVDDRLVLTFPRLTLRLPGLTLTDRRSGAHAGLERVVRALLDAFDISEQAQRIVESVPPLFRASSAIAWLKQPDGSLACVAAAREDPVTVATGDVLRRRVGLAARAVVERRALWELDVLGAPGGADANGFGSDASGAGHRTVLAVPLIIKGEVFGAVVTEHAEPGGLVQATLDRLRAFAGHIAPAMRNVQLFECAKVALANRVALANTEAASRAKDEFLTLLAHEFRNSGPYPRA